MTHDKADFVSGAGEGRKECRGKWRNGSAERVGTRWATACKTRDQQGLNNRSIQAQRQIQCASARSSVPGHEADAPGLEADAPGNEANAPGNEIVTRRTLISCAGLRSKRAGHTGGGVGANGRLR